MGPEATAAGSSFRTDHEENTQSTRYPKNEPYHCMDDLRGQQDPRPEEKIVQLRHVRQEMHTQIPNRDCEILQPMHNTSRRVIELIMDTNQEKLMKDLLDENKKLRASHNDIAALIHYQASLKAQDNWLVEAIESGLWTPEN